MKKGMKKDGVQNHRILGFDISSWQYLGFKEAVENWNNNQEEHHEQDKCRCTT